VWRLSSGRVPIRMPSSSLSVVNSKLPDAIPALADRAVQGDRRALSRLISRVEEGGPAAWSALSLIYPRTGQAQIIGVTGAPGTGKSTLVSEIAKYTRRHHPEVTVGIVAVFRRRGVGRSDSNA
jgi:putative protein kinase ArgK-like GTPase of G3E family